MSTSRDLHNISDVSLLAHDKDLTISTLIAKQEELSRQLSEKDREIVNLKSKLNESPSEFETPTPDMESPGNSYKEYMSLKDSNDALKASVVELMQANAELQELVQDGAKLTLELEKKLED